ncbi:endonuclease/exonuclease/phosphatase family protein [Albimonas sp. CAU 1670]|uniref:endonuclease/exonuclease/phosphatase family protein n=1 Tax=Albimonas sp. CAU 1670 TaxID=3032599 RepID=UPI0023DBD298|nr:endonuclease/exonuclease/phosphatase family protein [Albimonas sp. CAU 1670]MDF2235131.1 endonuclease/exonuclease/phosphatase family protein [Albimonas sp. CAU 1670]
MRIATFNLQNLRLRHVDGAPRLDGARDGDLSADIGAEAMALDPLDRRLTAEVLARADPDVAALQEVFDQAALDHFHDAWLLPAGARPWPHRVCLPGNDGRGEDVAAISRRPFRRVESHAAATPGSLGLDPIPGVGPHDRIFRRDCLELELDGPTLFVCHLKAPYPDPEAAWRVQRLEARAIRRIVERRFPRPEAALWMILGDLNAPRRSPPGHGPAAAPLLGGFAVDLLARLPEDERWTCRLPGAGGYIRPDAMLASPALAKAWPEATPRILRCGLGREAERYAGPRLRGVGLHRPHASDHAAVTIDLPGL